MTGDEITRERKRKRREGKGGEKENRYLGK